MSYSIRKKMLTALLVIIFLLMAIVGIIVIYNQTAYYKSEKMVETISVEMGKVHNLNQAIKSALMPANDYIITGDRKYEVIFQQQAGTIEVFFKDIEFFMALHEKQDFYIPREVKEEEEILRDARVSWKNISEVSLRIFAIPEPVGSKVAERLMEEMDYKWGQPVAIRLARWHEIDMNELTEAVKTLKTAWWRSWFIIGAAFVSLTAGGISFAFFYSNRFVRPIKELHNGADRIAEGDLDYRVVIKTGDEIEQLANQFNVMGERVKEFYSVLEERVRERTKELQYERDKLTCVFNAMVDGIYIVNKDYDVEYINPVLEKDFGPYLGRKCYDYFHDRTEVCPWCPNQEVFSGKTVRWEWHSSKNNRTYDLIDTPLRNPDGSVSKLEIFRDITEKKQNEAELKAHLNELERFRNVSIGRELRINELKEKNKALMEKLERLEKRS
ncbi:MAG: HAMP domain-containing protein [Nitrospirae bacterium]|nr:HAMP domain-containing protein [Nitrospirota bacterium]